MLASERSDIDYQDGDLVVIAISCPAHLKGEMGIAVFEKGFETVGVRAIGGGQQIQINPTWARKITWQDKIALRS